MRLRVTPSSAAAFEWETAAAEFRLGRGDKCGLRFQGEAGATVSWEHAEIISAADGSAYVMDLRSSNGVFVDGARISAQTPIRVGSTIQLGRSGPVLQVLELNAAVTKRVERVPVAVAAPVAAVVPSVNARSDGTTVWLVRNLGGFAAVMVIITLGFFALRHPPPADAPPAVPHPIPADSVAPPKVSQPAKTAQVNESAPATASQTEAAVAKTVADPWSEARQRGLASFRLIVVEDPKSHVSWPFSGAVIVGNKTLLTTASMGLELAKFFGRGWRVAALRPGQQERVAVTGLRVHAAFEQESKNQQLYFDMALLSTGEPVGEPIVLPSAAELAEMETGLPLMCLAVDHAGDPLDRFQQLEPQAYQSKVFAVTGLPPQPSGPKLLLVRGSFTDKACGSPIFNQHGHLVALYCEPAPSSAPEVADVHTHYAKVVDPQLIQLGEQGTDTRIWVPPQPATTAPKESSK